MEIRHYKDCIDAFEKNVIAEEADLLKQEGKWKELADLILSEWSVFQKTQRESLLPVMREVVTHLDPVADVLLIVHINRCMNDDVSRLLSDKGEYDAVQALLGTKKSLTPQNTGKAGVFTMINTLLQSDKISVPEKDKVYSLLPEADAKKTVDARWHHRGIGGKFPQKYAAGQRSAMMSSPDGSKREEEIQLLIHTCIPSAPIPEEFRELSFADSGKQTEFLKYFETSGNFQAVLTFLIRNENSFPEYCFLNYFLYALTYLPDLLDCAALDKICSGVFTKSVIRALAFDDDNARKQLTALSKENPEAFTALYAAALPHGEKTNPEGLSKAAASGSPVAAFFLVRDFGEKDKKINDLAAKTILSDEYCNLDGSKPEKPFIACKKDDSIETLRNRIMNQLSSDELSTMEALWTRFAAENLNPEKYADLHYVLYLLAQKCNHKPEDAMIRAAAAGNLDAMLDWYEFIKQSGWIVYQKRIREVIRTLYKLTPHQKVRLDLLTLVK